MPLVIGRFIGSKPQLSFLSSRVCDQVFEPYAVHVHGFRSQLQIDEGKMKGLDGRIVSFLCQNEELRKGVYTSLPKNQNSSSTIDSRFWLLHTTIVHGQLPAINLTPLYNDTSHDFSIHSSLNSDIDLSCFANKAQPSKSVKPNAFHDHLDHFSNLRSPHYHVNPLSPNIRIHCMPTEQYLQHP